MKLATAALATAMLAWPLAATAQAGAAAPTPPPVEKSTTVVVKEVPRSSPITFTPYGVVLVNAFFSDSPMTARNYPTPMVCTGGANCEGAILLDVRQSRVGSRLAFDDSAGWTKAVLAAVVEVDFQGGYGVGASGTQTTDTTNFYNPALRLRKALFDASWGTETRFILRFGQDDRLASPLRPLSLAYFANPEFQANGLLHGRAPQFQARFEMTPKDGLGVTAAVAALDPMDATVLGPTIPTGEVPAIDYGAGNRSRVPNFEGRVGVAWRSGGRNVVALGGWGGWQKNRYVDPSNQARVDVNTYLYGADLVLNFGYVQALAEIYKGYGYAAPGSLNSQGVALTVASTGGGTCSSTATTTPPAGSTYCTITKGEAVPAFGGWFQIAVGPPTLVQVYGGWGGTQTPYSALTGSLLASTNPASRAVQGYMWAFGAIGYAGKNWRFSAEYASDRTWFYSGQAARAGQFSVNSMLAF